MSTKRTIHNPMASFLQLLFLTVSIHTISITALSSTNNTGICSSNNTIFDPSTHKLVSQCSDHTFCSAPINGMCIPRLCRRDEFPFGYGPSEAPPPLCPQGSFCPDDGSGCLPLVSVGAPCEPNRDEQCSPPLDWQDLASFQNYNGSICLKSTCMCVNSWAVVVCIVVLRDVTPIPVQMASNTCSPSRGITAARLNSTAIRGLRPVNGLKQ